MNEDLDFLMPGCKCDKYQIRAVQLDLARQMESLEFIRRFIDFIAENGYNTLFLYLEWRIRTESFSCPADNECYTPQEMREIVRYAIARGIDVIPGLTSLGHSDLLLKQEAFKSYGELADGRNGRFWNNIQHCICPSHPNVLQLLESYYAEIADIFPSRYMHIGGDESWDIGYCERCAPKALTFKGEQELYLNHIKFCHGIVSGKLGKIMMIWDDMFEFYQDILSELPRDIVLVNWQYGSDITGYSGHFANKISTHRLDTYDRLGFDYLIAPGENSSNIRTLTEYARRGTHLAGGLLTCWEKSTVFMQRSLLSIAYAGRLWQSKDISSETLFRKIVTDLFGTDDELLIRTLWSLCEGGMPSPRLNDNSISYSCEGIKYSERARCEMERSFIEGFVEKVRTELGRTILQDLLRRIKFNLASSEAHIAVRKIALGDASASTLLANAAENLHELAKEYGETWDELRPGIKPDNASPFYEDCAKTAMGLSKRLSSGGLLRVRFCLPDKYSAAQTRISLKYGD
ncbi:MAG: family 20 glycosylhydrolase, partial [Lentisphaerota bacterium]